MGVGRVSREVPATECLERESMTGGLGEGGRGEGRPGESPDQVVLICFPRKLSFYPCGQWEVIEDFQGRISLLPFQIFKS